MIRCIVPLACALSLGCYNPSIASKGFTCIATDSPACPDGYSCVNGYCITGAAGTSGVDMAGTVIPKSLDYTGPHIDPMLNTVSMCPDADIEPNDDPSRATPIDAAPDTLPSKLAHLAICPIGPNPATGRHDVDFWKVDTTKYGSGPLTLMAQVYYQVLYGDLDAAILDVNGKLIAADASAVDNACVATSVMPGVYYVVVTAARNGNSVVNSYDMRVRTYSTPQSCPAQAGPLPDLGVACGQSGTPCTNPAACCSNICGALGTCQ